MKNKYWQRALLIGALLSRTATAVEPPAAGLDTTREALQKLVQSQQLLSQERRDWRVEKELLIERQQLLQREIASLETKIKEATASLSDADQKRAELVAANAEFRELSTTLLAHVTRLEGRVATLLPQLPDPLLDRLKPLTARLPADPATTKLSLAERFQNVIGILNEVTRFNREITVVNEIRPVGNGQTAEVKALYLGLGQAYYVTANGDAAGHGTPTPTGWTWQPNPALAAAVSHAVAILQNQKVATFIPLPVEIK
jgi:hypothetical protein